MAPTASGEQASTLLTSFDLHLFNEGKHNRLFEKFGAHLTELDGKQGTYFAVWAPDAERIQWLEPRLSPDDSARKLRGLGSLHARLGQGHGVQVPHPFAVSHV